MIEPLRLRSIYDETKYQQMKKFPRCLLCHREGKKNPSVFLCIDCKMKCYCEDCDRKNHQGTKKSMHKRKRIITGKPYKVKTVIDGDNFTFPKAHDWVTVNYRLFVKHDEEFHVGGGMGSRLMKRFRNMFVFKHKYGKLIDTTYKSYRGWWYREPLQFQVGCSGPCIHVQVLNCANVAALDSNGFSDPYVAVYWKDTFVGQTRVAQKTLHPEWQNESFVIPLDKNFLEAFKKRETSAVIINKNKGREHHHHDPSVWHPGDSLSEMEAGLIIREVNGENELAKLPKLSFNVYDYDRFSKNDFLGQKTLSDNEMLQILFEHKEDELRSFNLEPKKARGMLGVKLGLITSDNSSTLMLQITDGKNLPKADPFSLSDPYCVIFWDGKQIGKTKTIKNTLDPVWRHCYFEMDIESAEDFDNHELIIEVYDWDRIGSDDQLGLLKFSGKEMKALAEKSEETAALGLDDEALQVLENEWKRVEGTPKEKHYKINVLHKIDDEARAERERIKAENEAEQWRKLQEKIEAGLETPEEAKLRKRMEKEQRRKTRATQRAAKKALRKELKKRGMGSMIQRDSRDTRDTRDTRFTTTGGEDSLSAMLAAAKAEVDNDIAQGMDPEAELKMPEHGERGQRKSSMASRPSRQSRQTRNTRGSRGSKQGRRGSLMSELNEEQLAELATNPDLLIEKLRDGEIEVDKKSLAKEGEGGNDDQEVDEEGEDEVEEEEEEEIEEGYEKGVCVEFSEKLGIKMIFEDFDGLTTVEREEWVTIANIPMVIKIGKNEELEEIWRQIEINKQPLWKKLFMGTKKIASEIDEKKRVENSWIDKMMGRKNLGIKTYYPLFLPDKESGAKDVRGKIGLRILYHTRGSVLKGIDEVVQTMSLGEKCVINMRADYGFGEAFGDFNLPPHSEITVEVDLIGVRGAGYLYLLISRNANWVLHKFWLVLQCLIFIWELNGRYMCPLWCKTPWVKQKEDTFDDEDDDFDEDAMLADDSLVKSVEEGSSIEVSEEQKNESTLGARMLFAKF